MSTITRRPTKAKPTAADTAREAQVQAVIHKGLSVPQENGAMDDPNQEAQVKLRVPSALLRRVDAAVKARAIKTPRHRWLIEAIIEKLEREEASG